MDSNPGNNFATASTQVNAPLLGFTLRAIARGSGTGRVRSMPGGIVCQTASTCSVGLIAVNSPVTLIAEPNPGSRFKGWSGACSGTSTTCQLTLTASVTVTASFAAILDDGPVAAQTSAIKAVHVSQLRSAINRLRAAGKTSPTFRSPFLFADPITFPRVTTVRAVHLAEMRQALDEAYDALVTRQRTPTPSQLGKPHAQSTFSNCAMPPASWSETRKWRNTSHYPRQSERRR